MKAVLSRPFFKKYGKKALLVYIGWGLIKGLAFLLIGYKFFG